MWKFKQKKVPLLFVLGKIEGYQILKKKLHISQINQHFESHLKNMPFLKSLNNGMEYFVGLFQWFRDDSSLLANCISNLLDMSDEKTNKIEFVAELANKIKI